MSVHDEKIIVAFRGNTPQWINRSAHFLRVIGRVKPGVTSDAAAAEIASMARALEQQYPDTNQNIGGTATSLNESIVGNRASRFSRSGRELTLTS